MKGFKDDSGKFRPTGNNKGFRRSRDQSTKMQGIKIDSGLRKKRFLTDDDLDRLSDLQLNALLNDVEKKWDKKEQYSDEGDHNVIIYTNKSEPNYTFELHPLNDNIEYDESDEVPEEASMFNAWYWFPAKDRKGIPNSPSTLSETGGYTKKDALREFTKEFILYDQEFS